jgi:hypothetical protein
VVEPEEAQALDSERILSEMRNAIPPNLSTFEDVPEDLVADEQDETQCASRLFLIVSR